MKAVQSLPPPPPAAAAGVKGTDIEAHHKQGFAAGVVQGFGDGRSTANGVGGGYFVGREAGTLSNREQQQTQQQQQQQERRCLPVSDGLTTFDGRLTAAADGLTAAGDGLTAANAPSATYAPKYHGAAVPTWADWQKLWRYWDAATLEMIPAGGHLDQPISLRHPFIFYVGHTPAFIEARLAVVVPGWHRASPEQYTYIFSRGIDPDVDDPTQCK
jgi:hypothetical protein